MNEFLKKVSSYKLFNYLLPGILFALIVTKVTSYDLILKNLFYGLFVYYLIGIIISRIGSLIIDPVLMKISLIEYRSYDKYISASKKDEKLHEQLEAANTFRTIISLFLVLGIVKIYDLIQAKINISTNLEVLILILLIFALFILSYRKQSKYVTKRVKFYNKDSD